MWLRHLSNDLKKKKKRKKVSVLSGFLQVSALNWTFCEVGNISSFFFCFTALMCKEGESQLESGFCGSHFFFFLRTMLTFDVKHKEKENTNLKTL